MPSQNSTNASLEPGHDLKALITAAIPFLRSELHLIDPEVPGFIDVLRSSGAGECYHKDGRFLDHLTGVYRILKLWGAPDALARCGLFHSVYSNSYVDLAIFEPDDTGRAAVRSLVGVAAERLAHLFCIVPRHSLIHDDLLFRYPSDAELADHLASSETSLHKAKEEHFFDWTEAWREKINMVVPSEGVVVKHIKTGEDVRLSRRVVAAFLLMTMADFSDQYFAYQDELLGNDDGKLEFKGSNYTALWPGEFRPGLWMNSISRMGAIYALIAREEEICMLQRKTIDGDRDGGRPETDEEIVDLVIPPVFDKCRKILGTTEQEEAVEMYWEAMRSGSASEKAAELLRGSCERNPYVGEPRLALAQVYIGSGKYEEAELTAAEGLQRLLEWGTAWDKRVSWEGWVAWGRLLRSNARQRRWPTTAFGILNLGLVNSEWD